MPLFVDHNTGETFCQEDIELEDGRRNWKKRKRMSINVSKLMRAYDPARAERIKACGTYLEFAIVPDGSRRLHAANFCRERLCPLCQWRRSIKLGWQADQIYRKLNEEGYKHIFVTLTLRNCAGSELNRTTDLLLSAFSRLKRSKLWKDAIVGSYRALEITYNSEKDSYHPHLHILATVEDDYFRADNAAYITKDQLIRAWRRALGADYDPSVDIAGITQKEGQSITSACAEVCKYPVKSAEIKSSRVLETIDYALRGRRLIQWAGVAADARRELQLDDVETGNLVHTAGEEPTDADIKTIVFVWRYGLYIPIDFKLIKAENV